MNLHERIQKRFSSLTRGQQSLVQQLMGEYERFVFLSVNETAKNLGVHKSALVRLAQGLEFPGYAAFRSELQDMFRLEVTPGKKLGRTLAEIEDGNLLHQVVETERLYLQEALKTVGSDEISKAAELIAGAKRVFILGRYPQKPLADQLEFRLRRFHLDVVIITEEGRPLLEKLQLIEGGDVLVLYNFVGMIKEHRRAMEMAIELGCAVVMIADSIAKDLADATTVTLAARRGPATLYHTNIVPLAIQTAIILQIAKTHTQEALHWLEELQILRHQFGFESSLNTRKPPS